MKPRDRSLLFVGVAGFALSALAGEPGAEFKHFVPADKQLAPEWVAALTRRGEPEGWRGKDLVTIGMPVGGIAAGRPVQATARASNGRLTLTLAEEASLRAGESLEAALAAD